MRRFLSACLHGLAVFAMWSGLALMMLAACIEALCVLVRPPRPAFTPETRARLRADIEPQATTDLDRIFGGAPHSGRQ